MAICSLQEIVVVFLCASSVLLSVSLLYGDEMNLEQSAQIMSRMGENSQKRFGVIIDAGSSGSRVRVFSWLHGSLESLQNVPLPNEDFCEDVEPGISSYADKPEDAVSGLGPLFKCAQATIPASHVAQTPIFLMGTAGIRLLSATQQRTLLARLARDVCAIVKFYCRPEHFQAISGSDEGTYLWLSINHMLRNFVFSGSSALETVGVLDMGGASTQIASAAIEPSLESDESMTTVTVPGYIPKQHVYSKSVLGAGMTVSRQLVRLGIVETTAEAEGSNPSKRQINDPCSNVGYDETADLSKAMKLRQVSQAVINWIGDEKKVKVVGTGNADQCEALTKNLVRTIASCNGESLLPQSSQLLVSHSIEPNSRWTNCSFGNTLLPPLAARSFYSVSNYYYTARFFRLGETVSVGEFFDHARKLCGMNWNDIASVVDVQGPDPVEEFCFRSFYLAVFLQNGLGFSPNDHVSLHFVGSLNNSPTDWTMGAMLVEAGKLANSNSGGSQSHLQGESTMQHQLFGAHTFSAVALCLNLAVVALLVANSKRRSTSDSDGNSLGKSKMSPILSRRPPLEMLPLMNQDIA